MPSGVPIGEQESPGPEGKLGQYVVVPDRPRGLGHGLVRPPGGFGQCVAADQADQADQQWRRVEQPVRTAGQPGGAVRLERVPFPELNVHGIAQREFCDVECFVDRAGHRYAPLVKLDSAAPVAGHGVKQPRHPRRRHHQFQQRERRVGFKLPVG